MTFAVINQTAALTFFPGENPIGKQIMGGIRSPDGHVSSWKTIVGVVSDFKNAGLNVAPAPQVFINGLMHPNARNLLVIINARGEHPMIESAIFRKLHDIDPGLTAEFNVLTETLAEMSGGARFNALLVGSFALIALLVAVIGIYGVLAYSIAQRKQEIGIRLALGSGTRSIRNLLLREGIAPVLVGFGIGTVFVLALTRHLKTLVYGVSASDPRTLICAVLFLTFAALVAIFIPAYRASRLDPTAILRQQ